jgi:prepilin-type N-terminal cleavage/methylation domain-containing protein
MKKGFTLLEILLVIAAIGILAAIVIVAINPNRQLAQVRDAERQSEVNALHSALEQYLIQTGVYPLGITSVSQEVCAPGGSVDCLDLSGELVPTYLAAIPVDPEASGDGSGYSVSIDSSTSKVAVQSLYPELQDIIGVNSPAEGVLDIHSALVAFSLRRLSYSYEGPLITVRRTSDSITQDIGFNELGSLDRDSLEDFLAGSNGEVIVWHDQSGNDNDASEVSLGQVPLIASSGIVNTTSENKPLLDFSNDYLQLSFQPINGTSARSLYFVSNTNSGISAGSGIFGLTDGGGGAGGRFRVTGEIGVRINDGFAIASEDVSGADPHVVSLHIFESSNVNSVQFYKNNLPLVNVSTLSRSIDTVVDDAVIGRESPGNYFNGSIYEILLFDSEGLDQRDSITANMEAYWR